MTTFDMAKQIADTKIKAFALSNDIRDAQAAASSATAVTIKPTVDLSPALDNAFRTHVESKLPTREPLDPSLFDTMKAAFQSGNMVGSALTSESTAETLFPTQDAKEMTDDQIIEEVGKLGLSPLLQQFQGVTNKAQFDARANDLIREQKNMEIMEASGWTGVGAALVAGIVDIPTLIPIGKAVQLGRKGASMLETTGKVAAAGAIDATISEAGLQATQLLRTGEDAALNVVSSAILGAGLGVGVHKIVGIQKADEISDKFDGYRQDAAEGFPRAKAADTQLEAEFAAVNKGEAVPEVVPVETRPETYQQWSGWQSTSVGRRTQAETLSADPVAPGSVRVYHGGQPKDGEATKLWVSTDPQYAANYRPGSPLWYMDIPADHKMFNTDYPDQGLSAGFSFTAELDESLTAGRKLMPTSSTKPAPGSAKAAGAQAVDWEELRVQEKARGELADAKVSASLFDKIPSITTVPTEWVGKILGDRVLLGRPRDAISKAPFEAARQFGRMFYDSPEVSVANAQGMVNSRRMTVEGHIDEDWMMLGRFRREVTNIYAANKARFKSADDLAERAYYAVINENIDKIGGDPAVEAVARAFSKYTEYQEAKHVANGRLPHDSEYGRTAHGYVTRVINKIAMRANPARAKAMLMVWAKKRVTKDVEEELAHTDYEARLAAYNDSVDSFESRMAYWEGHDARQAEWYAAKRASEEDGLKEWRDKLSAWTSARKQAEDADTADLAEANSAYADKIEAWASDPANDGKKHPFAKEKPKQDKFTTNQVKFRGEFGAKPKKDDFVKPAADKFKAEKGDKPVKGEKPGITDGNRKPAIPTGKYGVPMLRENIDKYAQELVDHVYDTYAGVRSDLASPGTNRMRVRKGYLQGRVVEIQDETLAEELFLKTNLLEHAELLHNTSGKQAAFGSVFKKIDSYGKEIGDYDGDSILPRIEAEAKGAIDAAEGVEKTRLITERDRYIAGVKNEIDNALGKFDRSGSFISPKTAHTLATASYITKLGGVTVTSLTDAPKIAVAQGLGDTFRHGILPMFTDFRAAVSRSGDLRQRMQHWGIATEIIHNTRMRADFEINNPHQTGDAWTAFMDKASRTATTLSMISRWTDFVKTIANNVTMSRVIKYATTGSERLSQRNRAWLANIGLEDYDLRLINEAYAKQGQKHVGGVLVADLDNWDPELAGRFAAALRRESRNTIVTPGLGDRPQITYTTEGKLLYQFQTFMLLDQTRFLARQVQLANVGTDAAEKTRQRIALGAGLSSIVLTAVFVDSMKRALRENDAEWEQFSQRWQDNPGGSMYDALDRSGIMSSLFATSNTVGKLSGGAVSLRGGAQWAMGDRSRSEARKVSNVNFFGTMLGPSAGLVEDTVMAGAVVPLKVLTGGDLTRHDLNRYQNLIPFHSVPVIQQSLNELKDLTAAGIGLPPEPPHMGR